MEGSRSAECDRASETSSFIGDEEEEEEEEEEDEEEEEEEEALDTEEAEELTNSLKDLVQSEDVKPKLQYIMTNPSFSMVTCQSEDSGITWETSSSRCSTPWTSETSTASDLYSMESSPVGSPPGKVIFIMDEGKIIRKRTRKSSNRVPMATRPKGGQCNKKRDSSGMQRQEPRTVLGDVQASTLNVEQVEAQDTDEEMLDNKEDQENIAEEPVKRAPIRSIFRESRLRKVGPILGGPVQARIQLFNSIFGGTGPAPETLEKNRIRRSSSASGDSEKFLETSVKERLQKFGSLSTHPKHFPGARSKILETPSERRRKQRQQLTEQANQSFSSPTSSLEKQLTKKNEVSSENIEPYKMKESTLQHEERKERQPPLETPNQVSGHLRKNEEEAREQQSHSATGRTSITESTTSTPLKSGKKQVLLPSAENANKKPDQSLLTASDHWDEVKKQEVQPNSTPQSVSADFVSELDRLSSQHILPTESISEHPERETEKSYLPDVPSAESKYSTSTEIRQEDIIPQASEAAQSESEHVLLSYSGNETEKQETECPSSTALSATSGLMYSTEREEGQKTPSSETQNVHLENQTNSEQDFSLQETEKQGIKLKPPIPENKDSKYFGISYPVHTESEETQKTSAINKVDFDHSDFSIEENKQAEGGQMEMEHPDVSYSTEETGESETTQMETEHLDFSSPMEETELKGEQMEMEHPDFSFSREEIEEPGSAQLETELPDFSFSKEETEGSESQIPDTDYPEMLFSTKEAEKSGRSQLETEQPEFSSKEKTKEPESAQVEMEHPDFSFSREEMEESDSAQLEAEVSSFDKSEDLSYSREKMVESESAQLEMGHPDSALTKEVVKEMQSAQLENEHQVLLSREETENKAFSHFELEQSYSPEKQEEKEELVQVHSDLSYLMEETEKENSAELQLEHPDRFDSTGRAEIQQTGYLETAFSDLPYPINKTKEKELSQTDKGKQPRPVEQDSQFEGKLHSSAMAMQEETTQLQSEHPVWPHSTRKEQEHKTSQLKVKQPETTSSTGKAEHQKLQPNLEQTDPLYSQGETVQGAAQRNLECPESSCFISEAEQHENVQVVSEKRDLSFITGEVKQEGVESGTLWSQLTDRAKPWETTQMEQEQSFPSCSTAGTQQQETPPLNVPQPDVSWSFGRTEQDTVQREVKQQETDQQEAVQMETEYSGISESLGKEEPQVTDQINLAQQEIAQPGLVHPSLPYSPSEQMQEEMQTEPAFPEKTFYVSTETEKETVKHESQQQEIVHPELEKTFLPSSSEKEVPLEMEMTSEYPDLPYSSHEQETLLRNPNLPFHLKQQETEPVMVEHPDVSWDSGESKQVDIVEQESGHPELSYAMGETQQKSEHLDSQGSLSEAAQDESMEVESQYPNQSCSQLDYKYPDSPFSFGKGKEQSTQKFEPKHQELPKVGKKRASPATAQIESKHPESASWEMKHPDLSHSTGETSQEVAPLDQKHRKLSFGREKQQKATMQELEQEKLTHSPNKRDTSEHAQEGLEQPNLSFATDRPDDEMISPEVEHTDLISPLDNTEIQRRVQETEQTYVFGQMEQKTVQPEVEISHLSRSGGTAEETEMAEPGQGHSDLPYSVFKVGGLQTSQLKPEHPGLAHSLNKVQETIQLGLEKPGALYGHDKMEQIPPAELEQGHASLEPLAREVGQQGTEHTAVECSKEEQSVSRAEHSQAAKEKQRVPDASSLSGKIEQREMLKAEQKHPDLLHSIDKGKPQRTTQAMLEKPDLSSWPGTTEQEQTAGEEKPGFLHYFKKEAQGKKAQTELEHLGLCHSLSEAEQETLNAKSHHSDLSAGRLEHHEIIQPEAEIMDLSCSIGETQQTQIADEDLEGLDLFHSTGTVQQEKIQSEQEKTIEFSSSLKKAEKWKDAGMQAEHPELQCSMENTEGLQNSQANSEYADLSFSVGTAESHKTTEPELKEQSLLHSFVKTEPSWAALPETEHANVMDATGKVLHTDTSSSVSEEKRSAQLEVKQERRSYTLHPEEIVQLKLEQPVFSSPHGMEGQPNTSSVEGVFPDFLYSSGKTEKQDAAQAGFTPDISYSTGKSEQLQREKLNSKHPDLSYSLGKAETHVIKPLDLSYSCGKADQPRTAQLEHPEKPYFTGETKWRDGVQPEQPHVSLQSSDVETDQPETPSVAHTFVRSEEQGTVQPDFKQSDLLSPTYKAEKHEMAPLRAGRSQKQDTGPPSSQSPQLESEQQNTSFSTEEADSHKIQPYSSLTEQTVPVPLGASHIVSEISPEGSPKSSPVIGGSPPKHLDISYSSCKTEHSETALPEPGSFVARKEENTESLQYLPVAAKSKSECEILPEAEREQTAHYFHTATQLESEQINVSYSIDKTESLESQDYLTVPSKLQSEHSVPFYSADETCQQEVPPFSKPVSEYLIPTQSLTKQENQNTQPFVTQPIQSECERVIPPHNEQQLQKIQLSSPETASLKTVHLESMSQVQDQDKPESSLLDTMYLSPDQLRSFPKFTAEQYEQEMQPDVETVPRSVTTESKVTGAADQQAMPSESFIPFHKLPRKSELEKPVSVALTDDEEKQNIPLSLSDVADMLGKQSNKVSGIYTEGEHVHEMQQCFEDQKHTTLEHLGVVSSDLVHETVTHKTQHYSGEWGGLSSAEIKPLSSSSEEKQNPDIPSFGLASWLVEEVKARSISPVGVAEVDTQGIQLTPNEASDFGSKEFPAGSCTEFTVHGTTETKGHTFRVSESVSNKFSYKKSSDTGPRTQRYDLLSLVGDNQGPEKLLENETSTLNPTKIEAMQHLEVGKMSEVPEHYLRGEEEEMEHASSVEDSQRALETTEQKDLFNIISEGYEILNIHAPTHISSVDQEESKHMPDKLEYLETNPSFRRKSVEDGQRPLTSGRTTEISESSVLGKTASHELIELVKKDDDEETEETQQENLLLPENNNCAKLDPNNGTADMDYFEKYTLIDDKSPIKPQFERRISLSPVTEDPNESMEEAKSFKESTEVDTLEEFSLLEDLDEVFYGTIKGESKMQSYTDVSKPLPLQRSIDSSSKSITNVEDECKSPGTPLFDSEEGVLERSLLFPTTVAAVNPELLEEPPALSFLYKDLYAEAVGEKTKDETPSDEESGNSNASFPSRNSDTDDGTGIYFEKYILKDEIPSKAIGPQKDQIPEDESFSGEVLFWSSENKQEQGSGDVQYVKTEVLSERVVMERDKFQVDSNIQATICKPMHAIPFGSKTILSGAGTDITEEREEENVPVERTEELPEQSSQERYSHQVDYQGAAYQEASTKQEEQQDITAFPQMEKYVPYVRAPTEDSVDDQFTQEHLSYVPTIQETENADLEREEQHGDVYEDFAESMDYDVITQEELLQDEISSQFTHEELLFEDRDSFDHAADSYEFVNEPEQRTPVELEDSGFVVMYPEKSATNIPQVESPQRELKKAQADTYCYHCKCPISAIDKLFGEHKDHEVTTLDDAATKMKDQLSKLLTALEEKSMKIEEFVSDIELRFNSVEENCKKNADLLEKQNEEMLKKVVAQYDEKSENFEEVKKMKMEYLYEQMVNFQQTVDSAKETLETTVKETDEVDGFVFLNSSKELNKRLLSAMDTTVSLEKVPSAFSLFEHYADSPGQSNQHSLQHVAVPQTPTVIPQEPNSATSTSIAVYWAVNDGDTIDCFQVYCTEELQASKNAGALVEEYRVTVKESHCILEDLEPDRCYSVWVMAVNGTGCSLPSEKAIFKTAPAVPTIKAEDCTVCWDTATLRWRAASVSAESFILEYCRQHSPEGEGLRSFAGIKKPELKVSLEPNVNYFFYLRAVNPFGTSEQSEAALISTKGTRFRLLSDTAHPALQISSNATVIHLPEKTKLSGFPSVLGELLPAQGCHYWEIVVSACRSYRIGICYEAVTQSSVLGLSDTSWCMRCCPTQTSFLYRFLHTGVMSDVHVTEHLARIGILLDYNSGRLLFFNAERGLVLFAIRHKFTDAAHPAFALEKAGVLTLCTGMELPEFVKQS
ncbi:cardiomyopathy-associated protein 5 [Pyrgilauda ruficollis]|uniref:cardiomyopathy-associated protein 5 n=1 Tax=Pyrgilauda ruficollis TaxID=221976 RepID=UPI001B876492|nr:cardiomyopathy-associated protein 5 [Pyrgilauda ruficollis]